VQRFLVALACFILMTMPAGAQQTVELRVQLAVPPGEKVSGALVALVDAANGIVSESLSGSSGGVVLRARPGDYRVRVRRIGFRPFFSQTVTIPREAQLDIRVDSPPIVLSAMVVSVRAQCGGISRDAAALSTAWEEIAKALQARQLTVRDFKGIERWSVYRREVDAGGSVVSADTTFYPAPTGRPFAAIDPVSLVRDGYVRGDAVSGWDYYGPDEAVLLSRGFAETHCFRIVRDRKRQADVGVAFAPVPRRRVADIKGVLWLDASTSELREIEFQFVNVDLVDRFAPGGFTRFLRLPSGSWIVSEWLLRMPQIAIKSERFNTPALTGYIESGGGVVANPETEKR